MKKEKEKEKEKEKIETFQEEREKRFAVRFRAFAYPPRRKYNKFVEEFI